MERSCIGGHEYPPCIPAAHDAQVAARHDRSLSEVVYKAGFRSFDRPVPESP